MTDPLTVTAIEAVEISSDQESVHFKTKSKDGGIQTLACHVNDLSKIGSTILASGIPAFEARAKAGKQEQITMIDVEPVEGIGYFFATTSNGEPMMIIHFGAAQLNLKMPLDNLKALAEQATLAAGQLAAQDKKS